MPFKRNQLELIRIQSDTSLGSYFLPKGNLISEAKRGHSVYLIACIDLLHPSMATSFCQFLGDEA